MSLGVWLQVIGWLGSALLIFSVLQSKFLRFRILNGIASLVLAGYNALLGSWPQTVMNAVLIVINSYFLVRLLREQRAAKAFTYVRADKELRQWFLATHGPDVAWFYPDYVPVVVGETGHVTEQERDHAPDERTVVVFHQGKAIGLVAYVQRGPAADLLADYVIPSYRDYDPGTYVYSPSGPLADDGVTAVRIAGPLPAVEKYLRRMGYQAEGGVYTKALPVKPVEAT